MPRGKFLINFVISWPLRSNRKTTRKWRSKYTLQNNAHNIFIFQQKFQLVYTWRMKKIPFPPLYFIQLFKVLTETKRYIPGKLATWVHSSITPFMNIKDSLCKVSLLLAFILCPCGLVKFLLLLLLVEKV